MATNAQIAQHMISEIQQLKLRFSPASAWTMAAFDAVPLQLYLQFFNNIFVLDQMVRRFWMKRRIPGSGDLRALRKSLQRSPESYLTNKITHFLNYMLPIITYKIQHLVSLGLCIHYLSTSNIECVEESIGTEGRGGGERGDAGL